MRRNNSSSHLLRGARPVASRTFASFAVKIAGKAKVGVLGQALSSEANGEDGKNGIKGALLGLWGDFSLNGYRVHVEAAEVEEDVCLESLAVAIAA